VGERVDDLAVVDSAEDGAEELVNQVGHGDPSNGTAFNETVSHETASILSFILYANRAKKSHNRETRV
jgi:hypothetical protein